MSPSALGSGTMGTNKEGGNLLVIPEKKTKWLTRERILNCHQSLTATPGDEVTAFKIHQESTCETRTVYQVTVIFANKGEGKTVTCMGKTGRWGPRAFLEESGSELV